MIDLENSSVNGWYFEEVKNCVGVGTCEKGCGKTVELKSFDDYQNLKPCNCTQDERKIERGE